MSNWGRNFEFLQTPFMQHRLGRYKLHTTALPIGAPVKLRTASGVDSLGRQTLELATAATDKVVGRVGLAVYVHAFRALIGDDPFITDVSDKDLVPASKPCLLVHGTEVKVRFTNTEDREFLYNRDYTGRTMVDETGATIQLEPGDYLVPGGGNDTDGYYVKTTDVDDAWFLVTDVREDRGYVDAQMLF